MKKCIATRASIEEHARLSQYKNIYNFDDEDSWDDFHDVEELAKDIKLPALLRAGLMTTSVVTLGELKIFLDMLRGASKTYDSAAADKAYQAVMRDQYVVTLKARLEKLEAALNTIDETCSVAEKYLEEDEENDLIGPSYVAADEAVDKSSFRKKRAQ